MNLIFQINTIINKNFLFLFLVSFFLIKIPPFYIFYPIHNSLLTTHTLARLIILILFAYIIFETLIGKLKLIKKDDKTLAILFLIYFSFQSASVLGADNIAGFFQRYKDIVFPGIFLFLVFQVRNHREKIIYIFIASLIFNFVYQFIMFVFPTLFNSIGELFIYKNHFELVSINLQRSRLFIETYDEIAIPFLFLLISQAKNKSQKLTMILIFAAIVAPSFLSNFRSRILMLLFAFIASLLILNKKGTATLKVGIISSFLIIGYMAYLVLNIFFGFSFVDRFTLQDKKEDLDTVELRLNNLSSSLDMGLAKPFFGVGLGNYYDNLSSFKKVKLSLFNWQNKESEIASTNPHNIFAQIISETGLLSLFFYIFIIAYFFILDAKNILKKNYDYEKKAFIIAFWSLFVSSLFNPATTLPYNLLFWSIRGFI